MSRPGRRGSALVIACMLVVILGGLAISLTEAMVGGLKSGQDGGGELALAMAAESAANIAFDRLQGDSGLLRSDLATSAARAAALPTRADVEDGTGACDLSAAMGVTRVHGLAIGARWCYLGQRAVARTQVDGQPRLALVPSGSPGSLTQEVYFIRGWATQGGPADPETWRTRRVELLVVPYPQEVFGGALSARATPPILAGPAPLAAGTSRDEAIDLAEPDRLTRPGPPLPARLGVVGWYTSEGPGP